MKVQQSKIKTTEIIEKPLFFTVFRALELTKCEFGGGIPIYPNSRTVWGVFNQ